MSLSLAEIDMYNAVTEYRFDVLVDRTSSWEDMVFCRVMGMKEDEEDVDVLDGAFIVLITDMLRVVCDVAILFAAVLSRAS